MMRINLLPYRGRQRRRQIFQYLLVLTGTIAISLVICTSASLYGDSRLAAAKQGLHSLQVKNGILNRKLGQIRNLDKLRQDVERKLALINNLQHGRFRSLNTLVALSRAIPPHVWLSDLWDSSEGLHVEGMSDSNRAVADFMRCLGDKPVFARVELQLIVRKKRKTQSLREFSLVLRRRNESSLALRAGRADGGRT